MKEDIISPELVGPKEYKNLVVCWGSTYTIVKEALAEMARADTALLHYKQVHPLHQSTADYLKKANRTIIIESNATSQLGKQIKLHTGIDIDEKMLKYNGQSFAVDEVVERLDSLLD